MTVQGINPATLNPIHNPYKTPNLENPKPPNINPFKGAPKKTPFLAEVASRCGWLSPPLPVQKDPPAGIRQGSLLGSKVGALIIIGFPLKGSV